MALKTTRRQLKAFKGSKSVLRSSQDWQRAANKTQAPKADDNIVLENCIEDIPKGQQRKFKIPPVLPEPSPASQKKAAVPKNQTYASKNPVGKPAQKYRNHN